MNDDIRVLQTYKSLDIFSKNFSIRKRPIAMCHVILPCLDPNFLVTVRQWSRIKALERGKKAKSYKKSYYFKWRPSSYRSGKSLARQLSELEKKIRDYNSFYALADAPSKHEITSREVRQLRKNVLDIYLLSSCIELSGQRKTGIGGSSPRVLGH